MLSNDINELKQLRKEKQKTKKSLTDQIAKILYENKEADVSQIKEQRQQVRKEIKQLTQKINNPNYKNPTIKIRVRPDVCFEIFGKRHKDLTAEEKKEYFKITQRMSREKWTKERKEKESIYHKDYISNLKENNVDKYNKLQEKIQKRNNEYREKHKEEINQKRREYYYKHKEKSIEYYQKNKERYKNYSHNYQKENREKLNAYRREYNTKKKEVESNV